MKHARAVCPVCGRELAVRPPARGDGSIDVFPRHGGRGSAQCSGARTDVRPSDYRSEASR